MSEFAGKAAQTHQSHPHSAGHSPLPTVIVRYRFSSGVLRVVSRVAAAGLRQLNWGCLHVSLSLCLSLLPTAGVDVVKIPRSTWALNRPRSTKVKMVADALYWRSAKKQPRMARGRYVVVVEKGGRSAG